MVRNILSVVDEASEAWLDIPGVTGVGPGPKNDCIVVGCSCPESELTGRIPETFHGYPVVFEDWGIVSAQTSE